jgi:hypothetical protein
LIFVEPRFDVYKKVSLQIRAIFAEHTAVIEPLPNPPAEIIDTYSRKLSSE